ncbi:MAG: YigZ family protein [Clostridiales bacterium]|nr:YigZ family protein [Clostridiales bacterium]
MPDIAELDEWLTFSSECEAVLMEKKSKFIAAGRFAETGAEAEVFLQNRRKLHRDAKHHAFALRTGITRTGAAERCSDDGEPAGTAGLPILRLMRQARVQYAVIVVTRYFGGILLGTGGLARAYGASAKLLLEKENLIQKVHCQKFSLTVDYSFVGKIKNLIQNADVFTLDILYDAQVTFVLLARDRTAGPFLKQASDAACGGENAAMLECLYHAYPFPPSQRA